MGDTCFCQEVKISRRMSSLCFLIFLLYLFGCTGSWLQLREFALSCGMWDPAPWAGRDHWHPALGAWSPSHWTTAEVLSSWFVEEASLNGHISLLIFNFFSCIMFSPQTIPECLSIHILKRKGGGDQLGVWFSLKGLLCPQRGGSPSQPPPDPEKQPVLRELQWKCALVRGSSEVKHSRSLGG